MARVLRPVGPLKLGPKLRYVHQFTNENILHSRVLPSTEYHQPILHTAAFRIHRRYPGLSCVTHSPILAIQLPAPDPTPLPRGNTPSGTTPICNRQHTRTRTCTPPSAIHKVIPLHPHSPVPTVTLQRISDPPTRASHPHPVSSGSTPYPQSLPSPSTS